MTRDASKLSKDLPPLNREWQPERCVFDDPAEFGYRIFTEQYDQELEADDLGTDLAGVDRRRKLLEQIVDSQRETIDHLTKALSESTDLADMTVTLLMDHSGSLRRKAGTEPEDIPFFKGRTVVPPDSGAALAAGAALALGSALENYGVTVEILGFTTVDWCGAPSS